MAEDQRFWAVDWGLVMWAPVLCLCAAARGQAPAPAVPPNRSTEQIPTASSAEAPAPDSPPPSAHPYIATSLDPSELAFDPQQASEAERRLIQGVIDGLYPGMVQIQSGHVRITGVTRGSGGIENPYEAELFFDAPADRVMWSLRRAHGEYAFGRNDEESFTVTQAGEGRKFVLVKLRTEPPSVKFATPLDPRGLPYSSMMLLKTGMSLEEFWRIKQRYHSLEHVRRFRRLDEGALELVLSIPMQPVADGQPQRKSWSRIVLDERSGGHPVVVEEWLREDLDQAPNLNWRTTTVWKEIDLQWVPVEWFTNHPEWESATLQLDWKSVNREIEERHFQIGSLNLPKGSFVWDVRLGEKVLRERVGVIPPQALPPPSSPPSVPATHWMRPVLMAGNVVVIITIGIIAWRRHRFARRS